MASKAVTILSLWALATVSFAQLPLPGPNPVPAPPPPYLEVKVGDKVGITDYSKTKTAPGATTAGTFFFETTCTATMKNLPAGWSVLEYKWTPIDGIPPGSPMIANAYWFPAPGIGASLTGTAYGTGIFTASCTAKCQDIYGYIHYFSDTDSGAVIGGDLAINVYDAELPTYSRDDDDSKKPAYLQYFGHDPVTLPTLAQRPQKGSFSIAQGQPFGTVTTLSATGPVKSISNNGSTMNFGTTAETAAGGIVPKGTFSLTYDGASDSGNDCCASMNDPDRYKYTSHKPKKVTATKLNEQAISSPGYPYGWQRQDELVLTDNLDKPMPGVFVQERFDPSTPLPPNFHTSNTIYLWQSLAPDGKCNAPDTFAITLAQAYTKAAHPTVPYWFLKQSYFAGTRNNVWASAGGVNVGNYTISYWTDAIDHTKVP